jgi:DNA-binding protein H-NS
VNDKVLAALFSNAETLSRQVRAVRDQHVSLAPSTESFLALQRALGTFERNLKAFTPPAKFLADFATFQQTAERVAALMNGVTRAAEPTAPPAVVKARIQAVQADAPAVLESLEASKEKLRVLRQQRQKGQQERTQIIRAARAKFYEAVTAEKAKSDYLSIRSAIRRVLARAWKRSGKRPPWENLSPGRVKHLVTAGIRRYNREKADRKKG